MGNQRLFSRVVDKAMPFKHSCFISYAQGEHDLMQTFITELRSALRSELEAYFDVDIYFDKDRLLPGYNYNPALAKAICQSVCMIVVYVPKYEDHSYCRREYEAMRRLERERITALGKLAEPEFGMIIPIILRGDVEDLPPVIKDHKQFLDFSRFTTADSNIRNNAEYIERIKTVANYVYQVRKLCEKAGNDLFGGCAEFKLPKEQDIPPWRPGAPIEPPPFPGRERGR